MAFPQLFEYSNNKNFELYGYSFDDQGTADMLPGLPQCEPWPTGTSETTFFDCKPKEQKRGQK